MIAVLKGIESLWGKPPFGCKSRAGWYKQFASHSLTKMGTCVVLQVGCEPCAHSCCLPCRVTHDRDGDITCMLCTSNTSQPALLSILIAKKGNWFVITISVYSGTLSPPTVFRRKPRSILSWRTGLPMTQLVTSVAPKASLCCSPLLTQILVQGLHVLCQCCFPCPC